VDPEASRGRATYGVWERLVSLLRAVFVSRRTSMKAHPGFKAAASSIERKEGVSKERADAILAAGARKASAGARKANPRLNRVRGKK
jgi:hypothetical protein